ncbi:MAG: hypothetical protein JSS63_05425 [Bacteroidetes bacterium]|nr:hypothetical protein [Bacteroidota bacterium]
MSSFVTSLEEKLSRFYEDENYGACLGVCAEIFQFEKNNPIAWLYKGLCLAVKNLSYRYINTSELRDISSYFKNFIFYSDESLLADEKYKMLIVNSVKSLYYRTYYDSETEAVDYVIPNAVKFVFARNRLEDQIFNNKMYVNNYSILVSILESYFNKRQDVIVLQLLVKFLYDAYFPGNETGEFHNMRFQYFDKGELKKYGAMYVEYSSSLDKLLIQEFWNDIKVKKRRLTFDELKEIKESDKNLLDEIIEYYKENEEDYYNAEFKLLQSKIKKSEIAENENSKFLISAMIIACIIILAVLMIWRYNK